MTQAPVGQVTLVFANVQGATGLWDRATGPMAEANALYNGILRENLETCQGYEVKSEGDVFMAAFAHAMDAAQWCLRVQEQLVGAPWPQEIIDESFGAEVTTADGKILYRGLRVRMGIHVGEPSCEADPVTGRMDYFGPSVNRTARIANAGHGGQILLSNEVLESDDRLDTLHFIDLGVYRLRGVQEAGRLFQIQPQELSERLFPPLRALGAHKSNLPHQPNAFVGRKKSLQAVSHLFDEGHEVVSLVGPGGVGKSRLAIRYGSMQLVHYPGGVWYADVASAHTLGEFLTTLANSLSLSLYEFRDEEDQIQALTEAIRDCGRVLIIIDNFEHLTSLGEQTVESWAEGAPHAHFLVTSRRQLGLMDEAPLPLGPMNDQDGSRLFEQFAKTRSYAFVLDEQNKEVVRELVKRLDGIPLAIELAASRINILSPAKILARLNQRFKLLQNRDPHAEPRQKTLKATIDWSWNLLDPWEKAVLAQSTVFRGGFDLKAVNAVVNLAPFPDAPSIKRIAHRLVEMHLWERKMCWQGYHRYHLFESIREYGAMQLAEMGKNSDADPEGEVLVRHARYYVQFGEQDHLDSFSMKGGTRRRQKLVFELENIQTGLSFSLNEGNGKDAVLFGLAAMHVYGEQGPFRDAIETASQIEGQTGVPDALRVRLLLQKAKLSRWSEHAGHAESLLTEALALSKSIDDEVSEGTILTQLGDLQTHFGNLQEAETFCRRALLLHRKHQIRLQEGVTLGLLGKIYRFHHELNDEERLREARQYFKGALRIHRQIGNRAAEGWVHRALGDLLLDHGIRDEGLHNYEAALQILREEGQRFEETITLGNMGLAFLEDQHYVQARQYLEECVLLCQQLQVKATGYFMCALGEVMARLSMFSQAKQLVAEGEAIVRQQESGQRLLGLVVSYRGQVMRLSGDLRAAQAALEEGNKMLDGLSKGARFELVQSLDRLKAELEA